MSTEFYLGLRGFAARTAPESVAALARLRRKSGLFGFFAFPNLLGRPL